jgi:hypothetical protein
MQEMLKGLRSVENKLFILYILMISVTFSHIVDIKIVLGKSNAQGME